MVNSASPTWKDAAPPYPIGGGSAQHEQAGDHQRVRVDGPLEPGNRSMQVAADAG
jgi:hypothetical protein